MLVQGVLLVDDEAVAAAVLGLDFGDLVTIHGRQLGKLDVDIDPHRSTDEHRLSSHVSVVVVVRVRAVALNVVQGPGHSVEHSQDVRCVV